jgi:hypothetical protein
MKRGEVGLHDCGGCLSWLQRQFRLFFPGDNRFDKSGNLECRTSHVVLDVSLKREPHLYVSLAAVYWAHGAVCCVTEKPVLQLAVATAVRLAWLRRDSPHGGNPRKSAGASHVALVMMTGPVAPQTAASHILPERGAWALPGPKLVRTKGARSPEAKPSCGSFPQAYEFCHLSAISWSWS